MANEEKSSGNDVFSCVAEVPPDAIFAVKTSYNMCESDEKVNLGIGAYRDENGNPYVLNVVRQAEESLVKRYDTTGVSKEYQGIPGDKKFVQLSQRLMLEPETLRKGDKEASNSRLNDGTKDKKSCMAGVQSLSGTGALRVLFAFIKNTLAKTNPNLRVFMSDPTWGNHKKIIRDAGLAPNGEMKDINTYPYINTNISRVSLDFDGMIECLKTKPNPGDVILLHACAHNPTGVDPTPEQWSKIRAVMKERKLVPFFDCAYQGFATGSLEKDSAAVRAFADDGFDFLLAQSYAKNLGLYGERVGCASVMCQTAEIAGKVQTQLNGVVRPMYSNPPRHGMEIVKFVLENSENFKSWEQELQKMSGRINEMRGALKKELEALKVTSPTGTDWSHITSQIGMFSYTGLTPKQASACFLDVANKKADELAEIRKENGGKISNGNDVFLLKSGRISMAGLNANNVKKVASVFKRVVDPPKKET